MQTVKKGGALINTVMTKANPAMKTVYKFAKNHAKLGIKEVKSMLKQKETNEEEDDSLCSDGLSPNLQRRSNSDQLQNRFPATKRKNKVRPQHSHAGNHVEDDETDRASKVSSEDSGEVSAYIDDSDDSEQMDLESQYPAQMDLLGEILDTLSTTSSEQGKLYAAKSLDFFKSMDDINYKAGNKSNTPSEGNLAELGLKDASHLDWHLGQDDTVVHRKPLPPSPRKPPCFAQSPVTLEKKACKNSCVFAEDFTDITKTLVDSSLSSTSTATVACGIESNKEGKISPKVKEQKQTLTSADSTSEQQCPEVKPRYPSVLIPWEKEDSLIKSKGDSNEIDLLKEIDCLCSSFETGQPISSASSSTANSESKV
uniref:Uncharacterized protein n=2 Tax=Callorhinchus milii TaxID=7868 RepID=A0A4W3JW00_CALMI